MKLLIDENLSVRVAAVLRGAGHDAVHVTAVGLGSTNDEVILRAAADDGSTIVTADADFGTLLALRGAHRPSYSCFAPQTISPPSSKRHSSPRPSAASRANSPRGPSPA